MRVGVSAVSRRRKSSSNKSLSINHLNKQFSKKGISSKMFTINLPEGSVAQCHSPKMYKINPVNQNSSPNRCSDVVESIPGESVKYGISNFLSTPNCKNERQPEILKLAADYSSDSLREKIDSDNCRLIGEVGSYSERSCGKEVNGSETNSETMSTITDMDTTENSPVLKELTTTPKTPSRSSLRRLKKLKLSDKFTLSSEQKTSFSDSDRRTDGISSVPYSREVNRVPFKTVVETSQNSENFVTVDPSLQCQTNLQQSEEQSAASSLAESCVENDLSAQSDTSPGQSRKGVYSPSPSLAESFDELNSRTSSRTSLRLLKQRELSPATSLAEGYIDCDSGSSGRASLRLAEKQKMFKKTSISLKPDLKFNTQNSMPVFRKERNDSFDTTSEGIKSEEVLKLVEAASDSCLQGKTSLQELKQLRLPDQSFSKLVTGNGNFVAIDSVPSSSSENSVEAIPRPQSRTSLRQPKKRRYSDDYITFTSKNEKSFKSNGERRKTVVTVNNMTRLGKIEQKRDNTSLLQNKLSSRQPNEQKSPSLNSVTKSKMHDSGGKELGRVCVNKIKTKTTLSNKRKGVSSVSKSVADENYEVEEIVDHCTSKNKRYYYVKWVGWSYSDNTWEPEEHLSGCKEILKTYLNLLRERISELKFFSTQEYIDIQKKVVDISKTRLEKLMELYGKKNGIPYTVCSEEEAVYKMKSLLRYSQKQRDPKAVERTTNDILIRAFDMYRMVQLDALREWEEEMNSVAIEKSKIAVENVVDLEGPPENFIYINDYIAGEGVTIPDKPPFGCTCGPKCDRNSKSCCPQLFGDFCAYSYTRRLVVNMGTPIYECSSLCSCTDECSNRVVQKGRKINLCIFRTSTGCGWGVKTLQAIRAGSFICEYVGEVIKSEEADRRGKIYDAEGRTYLFDLDFFLEEMCPYTVDATKFGNISHFINHSCNPNAAVFAVWINCRDPNLPKLALFSKTDISAGEELTFDYSSNTSVRTENPAPPLNSSPRSRLVLPSSNNSHEVSATKIQCKCGSDQCKKYLF